MRVAFVGKGGSGKSVIVGTAARLLARRSGRPVLAIDSDPLPGLAFSLGLPDATAPIPDGAVEAYQDAGNGRTRYRLRLSPAETIFRFALSTPDGVRMLSFGKLGAGTGRLFASQAAFQQILDGLSELDWPVLGDLPGGTRQPFLGWSRYATLTVIVLTPSIAGLLSARRLARLAGGSNRVVAVLNQARDGEQATDWAARLPVPLIGVIPYDEAAREADRSGRALLDVAPAAPAVAAIGSLLDSLQTEAAT
ncbi:MAG: nucleotide-binding protein [Mycobacteriales bacterium]